MNQADSPPPAPATSGLPLPVLVGFLCLLVAVLFVISLAVGYAPLDWRAAGHELRTGEEGLASLIFLQLRLPRALLGMLVGFSLGLRGRPCRD